MGISINSGEFNRLVSLQRRTVGQDSYGQQVFAWTEVAKRWASITPLSGNELTNAQAAYPEVSHRIGMRYRTGVDAAMRIVYQGRVFNILAVQDVGTGHVRLALLCSEGRIQNEDDIIVSGDAGLYMAAGYVADGYVGI